MAPLERRDRVALVWIVVVSATILVLVVVFVALLLGSTLGDLDDPELAARDPEARRERQRALSQVPAPSERPGVSLPSVSLPAVGEVPADPDGAPFEELRCRYSGESRLTPGMPLDLMVRSEQSMTLVPGAAFTCPGRGTAGTVEMDATFPDIGIYQGVGAGTGTIRWTQLPRSVAAEAGPSPSSSLAVEVELAFPDIAVWLTITDGPYAGFRGVMILSEWKRVEDPPGTIVAIRTAPVDLALGRV